MVDLLYRVLESRLSALKKREYRLDRSIPLSLLVGTILRRFTWLVRGALKCLVLQRRIAFVFMAPQVNLRNAVLIRFGKGVTLERGVIIDGLSRNGIEFSDNVMIGPYSVIRASILSDVGVGLRMGKNSAMDAYSNMGATGGVTIGENVIMGQHISFHAENHNYDRVDIPIKHQGIRREGIVIDDDCWVGSNTTFLDGSHVGRGCVIAAGSVIRGEIPPHSIVVGGLARILRSRLPAEAPSSQPSKTAVSVAHSSRDRTQEDS